jgi:hypothetical protein
MSDQITEALKEWATPQQARCIDAVIESQGNVRAAARKLSLHHSTVQTNIRLAIEKAALKGHSPKHDMTKTVPAGFSIKGTSTLYDAEGNVSQQWVKTRADDEARERIIREAFASLYDEVPRVKKSHKPDLAATASSLCNVFTITDFHMGMLAWHKEGGDDWDLRIAEDTLEKFFDAMIAGAPHAKIAVINQLGDFLHQDGLRAETPTSGHLVDSDGRFSKIIQAALRALRRVIDRALETHEEVHVVMAEGNHDIVSSIWLRIMFSALYENEPRVTINDSEIPYYAFRWGSTLLGFHHGHLAKNASLPAIFAQQFRRMWGETDRCHIHTGHRHHMDFKEFPGAKVFQHPTMTARDAFAARGGWISERQGMCMTYHLDYGLQGMNIVTPEMLAPPKAVAR